MRSSNRHGCNSCQDSDHAEKDPDARMYEQRIAVAKAVDWANAKPYPVTLFLYDEGHGTNLIQDWRTILASTDWRSSTCPRSPRRPEPRSIPPARRSSKP